MNWLSDTVSEFGRQVGMTSLDLGPHDSVQLTFGSGTILAVERVVRIEEEEVLVYLGRPVGHQMASLLRIAMTKAHVANGGTLPVQVLTRGSGPGALLLALVRLPRPSFTPQTLTQAVDYLGRWLDEVETGRNQ